MIKPIRPKQVYGLRWIYCEAQYTYKGVQYTKSLFDMPIAVYVDKADVNYPDEVRTAWAGSDTEADPWQLSSRADLIKLKGFVDQGYDFSGMNFKMVQDISLDESWDTPSAAETAKATGPISSRSQAF